MDTIRKNCRIYYSMLYYAGLWPYDHSIRARVQRVVFNVLLISCIVLQVLTLKNVEHSLKNVVTMLSYTFLMMVYFLRYSGFIANFDLLRSFLEDIDRDYKRLKNKTEIEILSKQIRHSNCLSFVICGQVVIVFLIYILMLLVPTLLQWKYHQLHYLNFIGYFYNEHSRTNDLVCLQIVLSGLIGILAVASTEATFGVYGFYLSALFQIVSYRIRKAVDDSAVLIAPGSIDLRSAVIMHQRAFQRAGSVGTDMMFSSLSSILAAILSFSANLYHAFLAITETSPMDEVILTIAMVTGHVLIMFVDNYSGQALVDNSNEVFKETHNSLWYCVPLESQKMLLFIMMKSSTEVQFNLGGLFVPCYEGFATMMSSSFSYFTVLYSV